MYDALPRLEAKRKAQRQWVHAMIVVWTLIIGLAVVGGL